MSSSAITGPVLSDVRRSVSGTAAAPSWSFTASTGTGVYLVSADVLGLSTAGVQRVVVDASGNVGIGTGSPVYPLHTMTSATGTTVSSNIVARFSSNGSGRDAAIQLSDSVANSAVVGMLSGAMYFTTAGTERMRIDASGNLLVGTTTVLASGQAPGFDVANASGASTQIRFRNTGAAAGRYWRIGSDTGGTAYFINDASTGVYITYGNTGWTGLSDERHKTDLKPIENAAVKVTSLRAVTGRYKTDEEGKSRAFLIAQDVEKVLPEAVDTSNEERWGITYTDTIPLLVAAIQEQQEIIGKLEARLAALEAK